VSNVVSPRSCPAEAETGAATEAAVRQRARTLAAFFFAIPMFIVPPKKFKKFKKYLNYIMRNNTDGNDKTSVYHKAEYNIS
jgi:hypothetical protein